MPESSSIRFGDCELDLAGYEVRRGGQRRAVEPQVFELLAYLVRNAGRLVTKDELIAEVWGGRIVSDSALSGQIKSARQAIGDDGERQRLIRTVHGRGFRFVGELTHAHQPHGEEPAGAENPPLALPDKPSIAVLPFANLSGDPEQEYFADGMVEDITTALCRVREFFVIARNSAFAYKGKPVDVKRIGRELGVRYIVEGSVRRVGDRVRITGQLIDAETGAHLWADRYDGALADVFALQDQVTASVTRAIEPSLMRAEIDRAGRKPPESLVAYDYLLQALGVDRQYSRENTGRALHLGRRAVDLDQRYALAHSWIAFWLQRRRTNAWTLDDEGEKAEVLSAAQLAVALAPDDPSVLVNAGFALGHLRGDHVDASIRWLDRAITLNANSSAAFGLGAIIRNFVGDYATSARHAHHAMRLSPFDPLTWVFDLALGVSHFFRRELGDAIRHLRKSSQDNPGHPATFFFLACALAHSGRIDEARAAMARMLELRPVTTVAWQRRRGTHFPVEDFEYALEGARLAGLPE